MTQVKYTDKCHSISRFTDGGGLLMTHTNNLSEVRYQSSIDALRQLMSSNSQIGTTEYQGLSERGQSFCTITTIPNALFFTKSGIEYYFVEISCNNDVQYKIQAFGDEAVDLYREVRKYSHSKVRDDDGRVKGGV